MNWKATATQTVLDELGVVVSSGLSSAEVQSRTATYGPNQLAEGARKTTFRRFLEQFKNALIYILLVAAAVSAAVGEITDAIIIFAIVLLNAIVGVVQEGRAEQALEALKKMASPKAVVRRDGRTREVDAAALVPGDTVILEAGRVVPADIRLVESANLRMEESALTGESVPVEKDADAILDAEGVALGDQSNMAFSSTIVTYGRGVGVVVGTAMQTELGKIATLLEGQGDETTPLQRRLERFGRVLGFVILGLCGLMFAVGVLQELLKTGAITRAATLELFLTAVSLAVAAIPEGLPAIVTVVLAIGVQQMSRENAIVRQLAAVETLGSVTVVCSDKTGTLTQNRMTVTRFVTDGSIRDIAGLSTDDMAANALLTTLVHCNDATYTDTDSTGDPTEIALLEVGSRFGLHQRALIQEQARLAEKPFDSVRKMMSTVGRAGETGARVYTKGALDSILPLCSSIATSTGSRAITDDDRARIAHAGAAMSDEALRVLAAAIRDISDENIVIDDLETDLTFVGLVGMMDPPRLEVRDSIADCRLAGITPVMITGDHANTALAIAKELGIAQEKSQAISGSEIDLLTDLELAERSQTVRVFARVSPEHKVRIVQAFRARGHLVSMTGDGVNDAPSLKAADIGVAMGITGTDVAKGASDMVLADDNFTTIVSAIAAGRNIYANIKKAITFLLSCNAGEIIAVFTAILVGWQSPLLPIHILWINLITDSLPALGLGMDPGDPRVLTQPPRSPKESLFAGGTGVSVLLNGPLIGAITLVAFRLGLHLSDDSLTYARTMAFVVLAVSQLFHAFDVRDNHRSIFGLGLFTNKWLWLALGAGLLLQWIVVSVPALAGLFRVTSLSGRDWGIAIGLSLIPVVLNELVKLVRRVVR
jgi:P-type Ca2+ transporter type 2C